MMLFDTHMHGETTPGFLYGWFAAIALLWVTGAIIIAPEWISSQLGIERMSVERWFGESTEMRMYEKSQRWFAAIERGIGIEALQNYNANEKEAQGSIAQEISIMNFDMDGTIDSLWRIVQHGLYRTAVFIQVALLLIPLTIALFSDAIAVRSVTRAEQKMENPRIYHIAKHVFYGMLMAPIILAMIPMSLNTGIIFAWAGSLVFSMWMLAKNVEANL